jgi:lipid A 4'-phosphatase
MNEIGPRLFVEARAAASGGQATTVSSGFVPVVSSKAWQAGWRRRLRTPWSYRTRWPVFWPLAVLGLLTLAFRLTPLDLLISGWFYDAETAKWPWFFSAPCTAFYRLGIYPPFVLVSIGGGLMIAGRWIDGTDSLPRAGLFLVLLMVIGPGLIVNVGLKEYLGRARPHQVREFGGRYAYSPMGTPGPLEDGNSSFPSGHAAIAFYMMGPGFLVSRRRPGLAWKLFLGGAAYGVCMAATRVIQGGHFASDVIWAGGIVYLLGVILARLVLREES